MNVNVWQYMIALMEKNNQKIYALVRILCKQLMKGKLFSLVNQISDPDDIEALLDDEIDHSKHHDFGHRGGTKSITSMVAVLGIVSELLACRVH